MISIKEYNNIGAISHSTEHVWYIEQISLAEDFFGTILGMSHTVPPWIKQGRAENAYCKTKDPLPLQHFQSTSTTYRYRECIEYIPVYRHQHHHR